MRHTMISVFVILSLGSFCHPAVAQHHAYVLGAIGNGDLGVRFDPATLVRGDRRGFALGGGYEFGKHLSLEGAYEDFGRQTGRIQCPPGIPCLLVLYDPAVDFTAVSLSAVGSFPISGRLDGYGKLGLTRWRLDGQAAVFDDSGEDLHYGVGLRWSITDKWKAFAEYNKVELDLEGVSIGMRYGF